LSAGRTAQAMEHYTRAVALMPADAEIAVLHGVALRDANRTQESQRELIRAIALEPQRADSYRQLAHSFHSIGDRIQAANAFMAAATLAQTDAMLWRDGAEAMRLAARHTDALAMAQRAYQLTPENPRVAATWASALHRNGVLQEAVEVCARARAAWPADLHLALTHAMLLLTFETFHEGWALHERRLELPALTARQHPPESPRWDGAMLAGEHLLIRAEQGLGDQVQFVRWAVALRAAGAGRVTLQCAPQLVRLLQTALSVDAVIPTSGLAPPHDLHVDIMSLPHLLRTGADLLRQTVPYLSVPETNLAPGAALPSVPTGTMRIGVVWGGLPQHADDAVRSMSLTTLLPILRRADVQVVVLQHGPAREQLALLDVETRGALQDIAPRCRDMADTAQIIAGCDAVLTVDTSVAHVAGALGVPVWVMVAEPAEWRWGRGRADSLFYPSARVFRQTRSGDWSAVVEAVGLAIDTFITERQR